MLIDFITIDVDDDDRLLLIQSVSRLIFANGANVIDGKSLTDAVVVEDVAVVGVFVVVVVGDLLLLLVLQV